MNNNYDNGNKYINNDNTYIDNDIAKELDIDNRNNTYNKYIKNNKGKINKYNKE